MSATGLTVDLRGSQPFSLDTFDKALNDAIGQPGDEAPWRRLEETAAADEAQSRSLLEAYRAKLVAELPRPLHEVVAHRAVGFAADCFGENAPESIDVLRAVLATAPDADWAFRPLVVALTMAERWTDVLDAYDARLAAGRGDDQRAELLGEAARIAKDFTRDGARAIGYLDRLFRMRPLDGQVASSLERLLERERRWGELCAVWRLRLEALTGDEARELRLRLATTLHTELARPAEAVEVLRPLLDSPDAPAALTDRLEEIFVDERAPTETRLEVLEALRGRLLAAGRATRVAELLAVAIGFSTGERLQALRRECGERRRALGDIAGALEQYVALCALAPDDHEIEDRLRQLAELGGDAAALTRGLTAGAQATKVAGRRVELLMRAARVEDLQPGHKAEAAALFSAAAAEEVAPRELRVEALRRLEVLHDELGDMPARLDVLERLAAAEPDPGDKRLAWARVAELARGRGDVDRALGAWGGRLAVDPADGEALAASRELLLGAERWPALIELLRRRIDNAPAAHQVRADLVEIATLARTRTRELGKAIDTWREIATRFGEDDACVDALVELLAESGRFGELGELLTQRAGVDRRVHADRLARLGDTLRLRLDDARGAIGWYARALEVEPEHAAARAGLTALLTDAALAPQAAAPLARAAERTDGWQLLLELVPHRLQGLEDARARARLLEEAAGIAEERAGDKARAFEWLCQALPLAGENLALEREVLRLAEATGGAARAAQALASAITAGGWNPLPLAHLHERRGALLEENVGDLSGARASYEAALAITPERLAPRRRALGVAVRLGDLPAAAALLVDAAVSPATRANVLLPLYESLAREAGAVPAAAAALAQAADAAAELEPSARREVHARVAATLLGECEDPAAAETALARALSAEPGHVPTLKQRAEVQRRRGGDGLVETLQRLADEQPNDLDFLREAAAVALAKSDEPRAVELLGQLAERAARLAQLGAGTEAALEAAAHAIDESVRLHLSAGGAERIRRATAMLLEGARLPAASELRRAWLRRAAELTENQLADTTGAIRIWRTLHDEAPADATAREALARLYERERRFAEATSLRLAELEATENGARRLELRLEIVRLSELLEKQSNAPEVLRANLAERPGHVETVRRLADVLLAKGKPAELADVYEQQATILADEQQPSASATLWAELARLAEKNLGDARRAAAAWAEVAEREPTTEAFDALGRLALDAGQASAATGWLDRRLAMTEGPARVDVVAMLATAHLAAGQRHRAIAALERVLADEPRADGLRDRLAGLYREGQAWEPLARVLADGCDHTGDEAVVVARAREAAEVYTRLGMLARAVPVLEHAVRLLPRDEGLRLALADGLAQCDRRAEARTELLALVEQAGWRKSRKRAALHQRLGELARAEGDLPGALKELEQASSMDASNSVILRQLAEVAEAAGAVAQAERAYRALLVRRAEGESAPAATEILLRLFGLARQRGDSGEADELLESTLAAALEDGEEARCLQRALLARGDHELLDRLFAKRIARLAGTAAQADVHAEQAESLRAQGRLDEAFEAQLLAVEAASERDSFHEPLLTLGREAGKTEVLIDRLLALVERRRRKTETGVAAVLLLRVAEIAERDLGDDRRALELLRRAEEVAPRSLVVLTGLGRFAHKRGDDEECGRIAARLTELAAEATAPGDAAEALYGAAALELPRPQTRDAGIAKLCTALEKNPDLDRASALVEAAGLSQDELVKILPLYERIARRSGDERLLLDYLERRAATAAITVAEAREAVDLAVALGETARVEPLLVRLAEVGARDPEGRRDAAWASLELIQRKKSAGDLEGAAEALGRAAEANVIDPERCAALARELAERAAKAGNHQLGAALLERLRAQAPADESLWRPLLAHYVALHERAPLERLVEETLPLLPQVERRNHLRLARVRVLLQDDAGDPAVAEVLRDMLLDEPRNSEALALLADYYERSGAEDDLRDLLEQRFEAALEAREPGDVVEAALRLGKLLEGADSGRAAALYERALLVAKGRRPLLQRLIAVRGGEATPEYARQLEELLAMETGPEAVGLVQEIAALWKKLGDPAALRRVLERGHQLAPADAGIATELEGLYRARKAWALLTGLLENRAVHETAAERAVPLLLEAATLLDTELSDAAGALAMLRMARARQPENVGVVEAFARALADSGQIDAAVAEVTAAIAAPGGGGAAEPARRLPLSLLLAELEGARGNHGAAVTQLRGVVELDPENVSERLERALEIWRATAAGTGSPAELRAATVELAEHMRRRDDIPGARRLITELLQTAEPDAALIRLHAELAEDDGDLAGAVDATYNLMQLEDGDAQVAAANRLVELAARANRTPDATAAVEQLVAADPGRRALVDLLGTLYEKAGERGKLAALLYDAASRTEDEDQRFQLLHRTGAVALELGDSSLAVMALTEALAIRPGDESSGLLASDACVLGGALDEAAATLKPFVAAYKGKAAPGLAVLHARLARIAALAGDAKEELAALARALDADKKNGEIMGALADRAEAAGDLDLALKALRLITANNAAGPISPPDAFLRQARIAERRGERERAIMFARRAAQEAPKGDPIQLAARELITVLDGEPVRPRRS